MPDVAVHLKPLQQATIEDIRYLAANLREADRLEMHHHGLDPLSGLLKSFELSEVCYAAFLGEELVCVYGVCPGVGVAVPWMMGTPSMSKVRRETLTWATAVKAELSDKYPLLMNYVWSGNKTHIRWIKWLGFGFTGEKLTLNGEEFLQFTSRK